MERIISMIFRLIRFGFKCFLFAVYGKKQGVLPPIKNNLLTQSATNLARQIRRKEIKSEDVVQAFINRIKEVNPIINAMVEDRFLNALCEAKEVDNQLACSRKTEEEIARDTPFLGIPLTTKNGIGVKGLIIDVGVVFKKGEKAVNDSIAIKRMREAGAIPLCVTNVPELCLWFDAANNIYGRTLNPYDLNRISGGSSGGEGALISSAGSVIGVGNDLGGSIRIPSFCCGVFGHKTTPLIVPQDGQFPTAHDNTMKNYFSTGPICRYAEDLKPMLKCLAGDKSQLRNLDDKDVIKLLQKSTEDDVSAENSMINYEPEINIRDLNIFYIEKHDTLPHVTPISKEIRESIFKVVKKLHKEFGNKVRKINIPEFRNSQDLWLTRITANSNSPATEDLLTGGRYRINPYLELLKWFFRLSNHTFYLIFSLLTDRWHPAIRCQNVVSTNLKTIDELKLYLINLLGENGVLIYPSSPEAAMYHQEQILQFFNWGGMGIFNALGFPVTQCPLGLNKDGLPMGLQLVAAPNNDRLTLELAKYIEVEFGGWRQPSYRN